MTSNDVVKHFQGIVNSAHVGLLEDYPEAAARMSQGNPGAVNVLIKLHNNMHHIDPESLTPLFMLKLLDTLGIYGPNIWNLFAYVCDRDIFKFHTAVRAAGFSFISPKQFYESIDQRKALFDHKDVLQQLQTILRGFGRHNPNDIE